MAFKPSIWASGAPFTEEESKLIRSTFRSLPSYDPETDSLPESSMPEYCVAIGFPAAEYQLKAYQGHWIKFNGGRIDAEGMSRIMESIGENDRTYFTTLIRDCDKNGDGFIQADEFKELIAVSIAYNPKFKDVSYEQFQKEADTNRDGQISLDEAFMWIQKNINF